MPIVLVDVQDVRFRLRKPDVCVRVVIPSENAPHVHIPITRRALLDALKHYPSKQAVTANLEGGVLRFYKVD